MTIAGRQLKLTNLNKTFWPQLGLTKGDLIEYYLEMADTILPYLAGRPQTLRRHPDGADSEGFYQKNIEEAPAWLKTQRMQSESTGEAINYAVCDDRASLVYLVNLGCIEMHVWNSRVGSLDRPDYMVIDLDPEDAPFSYVVDTALAVLEAGTSLGIDAHCKTSGATGMHLYVPLAAKYSYEQARLLARIIAIIVHAKRPDITSLERSPDKRQGKVYLDTGQNVRGATMAAPYCIRATAEATVSAPLAWSEIGPRLDPLTFNIKTIRDRTETVGDIFRPVLGKGLDLDDVLKRLAEMGMTGADAFPGDQNQPSPAPGS